MVQIGYTLSSEEFRPNELVDLAVQAEEIGFDFASISDHYHPWMDSQGHSPFVWSTLGGIAARTSRIPVMTGVTALSIRYHPTILAQAVATVADMMPGRFRFGIGTGEALNEHVTGEVWPPVSIRQEMMIESLEIMRELWQGGYTTVQGNYYEVHNARLYTLPEELPPIIVGASGPESAEIAAEIGDALCSTSPDKEVADAFDAAGGSGKPKYGQITVCYGADEEQAAQTAMDIWGYTILGGQASQELALPKHYQEAIASLITPEVIKESVVCGPDPAKYHEKVQAYLDAGYTHLYFHQVGQDQKSFFEFAQKELLPKYTG
jgi:coenzyme F420-dependent glucose-6-phosphate dehydrogenase